MLTLEKPVETRTAGQRALLTLYHLLGGTVLWFLLTFPFHPKDLLPQRAEPWLLVFAALVVLLQANYRWWAFAVVLAPCAYYLYILFPFVSLRFWFLTALGVDRFLAYFKQARAYLWGVSTFSGVVLVIVGVMIYANTLTIITSFLERYAIGWYLGQ